MEKREYITTEATREWHRKYYRAKREEILRRRKELLEGVSEEAPQPVIQQPKIYVKCCRHCKKEFVTDVKNLSYCSKDCLLAARRERDKARKGKAKPTVSLAEAAIKAREAGLTYGQYMCKKYKEEMRNEANPGAD